MNDSITDKHNKVLKYIFRTTVIKAVLKYLKRAIPKEMARKQPLVLIKP